VVRQTTPFAPFLNLFMCQPVFRRRNQVMIPQPALFHDLVERLRAALYGLRRLACALLSELASLLFSLELIIHLPPDHIYAT